MWEFLLPRGASCWGSDRSTLPLMGFFVLLYVLCGWLMAWFPALHLWWWVVSLTWTSPNWDKHEVARNPGYLIEGIQGIKLFWWGFKMSMLSFFLSSILASQTAHTSLRFGAATILGCTCAYTTRLMVSNFCLCSVTWGHFADVQLEGVVFSSNAPRIWRVGYPKYVRLTIL